MTIVETLVGDYITSIASRYDLNLYRVDGRCHFELRGPDNVPSPNRIAYLIHYDDKLENKYYKRSFQFNFRMTQKEIEGIIMNACLAFEGDLTKLYKEVVRDDTASFTEGLIPS